MSKKWKIRQKLIKMGGKNCLANGKKWERKFRDGEETKEEEKGQNIWGRGGSRKCGFGKSATAQ